MLRPKGNRIQSKSTGFSNTLSGSLNAKTTQGFYKPLKINHVQQQELLLDTKTLKKGLQQRKLQQLQKTVGYRQIKEQEIQITLQKFAKDPQNKILSCLYGFTEQKKTIKLIELQEQIQYIPNLNKTIIDTENVNLFLKLDKKFQKFTQKNVLEKPKQVKLNNYMKSIADGNSVISIFIKNNYKELPKVDTVDILEQSDENRLSVNFTKQNKLKDLMSKKNIADHKKKIQNKQKDRGKSIDVANVSISQEDYLKDDFQKESFIKQSIIKQSIRESGIRQSIRESIKQSGIKQSAIKQSIRQSNKSIRQSIRESIKTQSGIKESIRSIGQQIKQQISSRITGNEDKKKKNNEQIVEESIQQIYDQDFQEVSTSKYHNITPGRKEKVHTEESMSKSFRKKKSFINSIKIAEQSHIKQSKQQFEEYVKKNQSVYQRHNMKSQFNHLKQIVEEKKQIKKIQNEVKQLLNRTKNVQSNWKKQQTDERQRYSKQRANNLYYKFQTQFTRLISNYELDHKLKQITSFLPQNLTNQNESQNTLTNAILTKVLQSISALRQTTLDYQNIHKMQQQYDKKMNQLLQNQERILRWEMQKRLNERDQQFKKLIQGITQTKVINTGRDKILDVLRKNNNNISKGTPDRSVKKQKTQSQIQQYQNTFQQISASKKQSASFGQSLDIRDQSFQGSSVSWQSIDLWNNLSENQKLKLYERQADQVTDFLTGMMLKQLRNQVLQRSIDVSFEFPNDLSNLPQLKPHTQKEEVFKLGFNRKQIELQLSSSGEEEFDQFKLPALPQKKQPAQKLKKQYEQEVIHQEKKFLKKDLQAIKKSQIVCNKYQKKIQNKAQKTIKKMLKEIINKEQYITNIIAQIKFLEDKEIDKQDLVYVRLLEENIFKQIIGIYNNHHQLSIKQLEKQCMNRFQRVFQNAKQQTKNDVQEVIPQDYQNNNGNMTVNELIKSYENKQLLKQSIIPQNCIEFESQKDWKLIKGKIEEDILNTLILQTAKEIKKKK